jgi:isopenicillin N synthase-like dioxygenase
MSAHAFTSIPVIDLSLASSSPASKHELLSQLRHAVERVGFLYVSNHGVPVNVISDLVDALPRLFSLPGDAKEEMALHDSPHFLGYSSVGAETTAGKTDRREQVEYATELPEQWSPGNGLPLFERLKGPNQVQSLDVFVSH